MYLRGTISSFSWAGKSAVVGNRPTIVSVPSMVTENLRMRRRLSCEKD